MANISIPDLHLSDNQNQLDELTPSEMNNLMGGSITINLPVNNSNKEFMDLFKALSDPNGKPINITIGTNSSLSNPLPSNPFDRAANPF
ncbi:hypothetical protein [Calothrix sp. NIES-2098]|uniref:hypothetical protein n=1 Tax=Calothrix sp. NIES-2098 TaxID=1954171 RepID=UPI000B61D889|nr:hypothetical protein NIES2098_12510 [Calothrix sp. NIES-2098]